MPYYAPVGWENAPQKMINSLQTSKEVKIFKMHEWKHNKREILRTIWTINIAVTTEVL